MTAPRIFVSYSHDTPEHKAWVLQLASFLVENGIDVVIDAWNLRRGEDLPKFMEDALTAADRVLMICTERYVQKADAGVGGVGYEKMIVTAELIKNLGTAKFIPVIRQSVPEYKVPKFMGTRFYVDLSEGVDVAREREHLLRELHDVPPPRPPLGPSPFAALQAAASIPNTTTSSKQDPLAHAAASLAACSFVESGNGSIARTRARDDEGRDSEHVFWHHSPSAWLRLVPANSRHFERMALRQRVERAVPPLRAFGDAARQHIESNQYGMVVLGYDGDELPHIAMQLSQVFRSGEIWGLNRSLIEPRVVKPTRKFQIPWPETELQFRQTLAQYLAFARDALELPLPLTLVAGLAMVGEAEFVGEKAKWFSNPPPRTPCFQSFISHQAMIPKWDVEQAPSLDPFFKNILDECDQDSSKWLGVLRPKP